MKNALLTIIQMFALWLLRKVGSKPVHVPKYMETYWDEITQLVKKEHTENYPGYFKYRRVFTIMAKRYPAMDKRALSKAVIVCADEVAGV